MTLFFRQIIVTTLMIGSSITTTMYSNPSMVKGSGSLADPIQITTCQQLQDISQNLNANYVLANDIDCSDTKNWNAGAGFAPIDDFSGTLDGENFTIKDLFINSNGKLYTGIFSSISSGSAIQNLKTEHEIVEGSAIQVGGGLVGWIKGGGVI